MTVRDILKMGDSRLLQIAAPVKAFDTPELHALIADMKDTMAAANGAGLAAPQIGVDQAMQFNTDATAALAGLLQNLQGAKQQLDQALGVVTGQAQPTIPGQDELDADLGAEMGAELGAELGAEELPPEEPEAPELGGAGLGRAKR